MAFQKGQSGNPKGGKKGNRGGTGRPRDEYLAAARAIGDPLAVLQFYYDVASGKPVDVQPALNGENVLVPASIKDRINAGERYLDRLPQVGPVKQHVEHSGEGARRMVMIFPEDGDPKHG